MKSRLMTYTSALDNLILTTTPGPVIHRSCIHYNPTLEEGCALADPLPQRGSAPSSRWASAVTNPPPPPHPLL